jgi:hypothetical protein
MPHTDDTVTRSHRPLGRHDNVGNIHIAQKIRCLVYRSSQFCVGCCITCGVNLMILSKGADNRILSVPFYLYATKDIKPPWSSITIINYPIIIIIIIAYYIINA